MLTMVYQTGLDNAARHPGVANPGGQATLDAVSGITGLAINYCALINVHGFVELVDAVGGVTLAVRQPVTVGAVGTTFYTISPGVHHFDGNEALWYARTRMDGNDDDRIHQAVKQAIRASEDRDRGIDSSDSQIVPDLQSICDLWCATTFVNQSDDRCGGLHDDDSPGEGG